MKKILGLDLGVGSIGWAYVNQAETKNENSEIIKIGVRVNPLTVDEQTNFEKGKSITTNADRTLKRSMRRNLQRFKLRRDELVKILKDHHFIKDDTFLAENGNKTTFQTYRLRAKAATEEISLEELARVLLMINKKRGYKSSRKAKSSDEDGFIIDGMEVAKKLYEEHLTPGQFMFHQISLGKTSKIDFYRSDLQNELAAIWNFQKQFYPTVLTETLWNDIQNKNESQTWAICSNPFNIVGIKREGKKPEQLVENYRWRDEALSNKMDLERLAIVLQKINSQINSSSGYLGAISDRSKELYFNSQTVGQYLMAKLDKNPNYSLTNQVFYRQDYLNEFETIWETQAKFHPELTPELKREIRDVVIFYQRPLKSQKGLISFCELESRKIEVEIEGKKKIKTVGCRVCPKSSPIFQEFKIWQVLNNIEVFGKGYERRPLFLNEKQTLYKELSIKAKLSKSEALKLLYDNYRELDFNYKEIEGNRTQAELFKAYQTIIELSGNGEFDFAKMPADKIYQTVTEIFSTLGFNTDILHFNSDLGGDLLEKQPMYMLWHLLYSFEGDGSKTGDEKLLEKISSLYGFNKEYAKVLANTIFQPEYGSLSSKAMRKILPYMKEGSEYSEACVLAGYNHSKDSLTKEELDNKTLKKHLEILPKNTLRNPVVEKILNQMINVVNSAIDEYGKPDEVHIELARELKKSAKEREELTKIVSSNNREYEEYKKILETEFGIAHVSRNDIIRYRLYKELEYNGYKTLYSNTYIPKEKIFSKEFDIEHIIPQSRLFDDSFSNKTLESRSINIEKSNDTAYDFIINKYGEDYAKNYLVRVEDMMNNGKISKTKFKKLIMKGNEIPEGFIERDLRDSQYIAKKAQEMLKELVRDVVATSGSITDRLREDWQLIDIMQELNWDKYNKLGLTEYYQDRDGRQIRHIKDWTKRNDHRHHAMDALTIAFTKRCHIQYLNNLNARLEKGSDDYVNISDYNTLDIPFRDRAKVVRAIEQKELYRDKDHKLRFIPPMPLDVFRAEAKKHLENTLVSIKAKNKVVTKNTNKTKKKSGYGKSVQLTPRGQLHLETVYGSMKQYATKLEKVNASFTEEKIQTVANKVERDALLKRLAEFGGDAKKAFTGKNSLEKNPIFLDENHSRKIDDKVKTVGFEQIFTIRKAISPDLKIEKVMDSHIRAILTERLAEYNGDAKKAFSNLNEHPIWLNKEKGIDVKRVTISGISNAIALHDKKDHNGNFILDETGNKQPVNFVNTGNNHHVVVYRKPVIDNDGIQKTDENGNLMYEIDDNIVPFFVAVERARQGLPIIDKTFNQNKGWTFLFTMKQNEYFVFPNEETGFDPNEIDLLNPHNFAKISPNLYRVQKMSKVKAGNSFVREYVFRHHLETSVEDRKELKDITWKKFQSTSKLGDIVKVRINHLGQIVSVGEY
ncbi:MAG: type II CRISPR RNA-guided endonuclease Cas9 [Bacteroidales bacterium]|nr:type II CRISPR RNA-guided endonuclease Cas9 [Bacteroidales bacterium]